MEQITHTHITAAAICDALGRRAIADRLGVGLTAVSNAAVDGKFPASWFAALLDMCCASDVELPLSVFNWRGINTGAANDPSTPA